MSEIICALEPTGTYHQTVATFLEAHRVDVVLVCNHVSALDRRTLDRTWGKSDPTDAHNLCDLLERGLVLSYSPPDDRLATLRRLVRLLRQARTELAAAKARLAGATTHSTTTMERGSIHERRGTPEEWANGRTHDVSTPQGGSGC